MRPFSMIDTQEAHVIPSIFCEANHFQQTRTLQTYLQLQVAWLRGLERLCFVTNAPDDLLQGLGTGRLGVVGHIRPAQG